jgi:allophanate hydrolase subunit 2
MIRATVPGLFREVGPPGYGFQDVGQAPGGPQDRFSWACARILLGETPDIRTWELVSPPVMEVEQDAVGVITGGGFDEVRCSGRVVDHTVVFEVRAGDRISWGIRSHGFRSVLALRPAAPDSRRHLGVQRGPFSKVASWPGRPGTLRVVAGPEVKEVRSAGDLLRSPWVTSLTSSDTGLRLEGRVPSAETGDLRQMVSAPVSDGTVQLTPEGLILLLRCRPTIGGYPRVFTVIDADVDLAAQIPPRRRIRFTEVTHGEAIAVRRRQRDDLDRLRDTVRKSCKE